ncbi:sensor domain-containing diguanylate cyclase [Bacillus sp. EAC]|uniref:sensor domain-containing diguanylate cyclase n=1 Tax=Bacillus sp. EAC TaxID=1978338 RepID=UPI000B4532D6|nr:sensor domain-containing diguanylate cyclase [Bacillus sp. EAC]
MEELQEARDKVESLVTLKTNSHQRRFVYIVAAIITIISLISVPFANLQLPEILAYQPAIFTTLITFELMTAMILYNQFRISGSPAILVLSAGYLYSAGMSLMYLLTFPGVFTEHGLFHAGLQTAPWLYLFWHLGYPIFILVYLMVESKYKNLLLNEKSARIATIFTISTVLLLIIGLSFVTVFFHDYLPIVLNEGKLTSLFIYGLGTPILLTCLLTLIYFYWKKRARTITSAWLCVALLASFLDVAIVLCGGQRYSLGWYVAKWNTLVSANIVLVGMIYEFSKMYIRMTELYRIVIESEYNYKKLFNESKKAEGKIAEQNEVIKIMAYYDELTGLPNRRYLLDKLTETINQADEETRFSVLFLDLDGFKQVNDQYGHEIGDCLLEKVANCLENTVDQQGFSARWAGDELIILLDDQIKQERVDEIAFDIIRSIQQINSIDGKDIVVTVSIGISVYPNDGQDVKTLLKHADLAMYQAKQFGKNSYRYYSPLSDNKL